MLSTEFLPPSITITVALLTFFLISVTALKYATDNHFVRVRFLMTSFFAFIVATLTISFWEYTLATLPYTIPAFLFGAGVGYMLGVRTEQKKLSIEGAAYYMEHFAHVHLKDVEKLSWWSLINFYSVMSALVMINLVGLSTVIFKGSEFMAVGTCAVGAFLLGSIVPYLAHLWSIKPIQNTSSTTSEA